MDPRVMAAEGVEEIERLKKELAEAIADENDAVSRATSVMQQLEDLGVDAQAEYGKLGGL